MSDVDPLALLVAFLHLPLGIAALVLFFQLKQAGDPEMRRAGTVALSMLGFEVLALWLRETPVPATEMVTIVALDTVLVLKLWVTVYVGLTLWRQHGVSYWQGASWGASDRHTAGIGGVVTLVMVAYTFALFGLTQPTTGPVLEALAARSAAGVPPSLGLQLLVAANFAIAEELIYRGCLQAMFTRWFGNSARGSWLAIIATTTMWTLAHVGMLSPDWVKFVQVLPLGIFLGWWFRQAGLVGATGVHLAFNLIITSLGTFLLPEGG